MLPALVRAVRIRLRNGAQLEGELNLPEGAAGLVIFAHGSGSSRFSPRNQAVARVLRAAGVGTLLFDLLTRAEEIEDNLTRRLRFDIGLLAGRLEEVAAWAGRFPETRKLGVGFFGSSTGGGAALVAAARLGGAVQAVVSRGGRLDLAAEALPLVQAPTLLVVGENDPAVLRLNEEAFVRLRCNKQLEVIPGATHLFEEEGALETVARLVARWFQPRLHAHPPAG